MESLERKIIKISNIENKLVQMGIKLPSPPKSAAVYLPVTQVGNMLYTSGQDCRVDDSLLYKGKVGSEATLEEDYEASRQCIINCLAVLKEYLEDLDKISQFFKALAFINSEKGFLEQPYVINGAPEFLEEVFEEKGKHARSTITSNELTFNTPVEIEVIVEINDVKKGD